MMDDLHTDWSDAGPLRERLLELPAAPDALPDAIENFLIHHAIARAIGFGVPATAEGDRSLRTAARLLAVISARDSRPLPEHRALANYAYGTCHDFALLAASALRERGTPARLRAGFASYFRAGRWEDHWICEHWTGSRWAVLDAQLGRRARDGFAIGFDVADVPAHGWRSAASVWRAIRSGEIEADACGVSFAGIKGAWFVAASVLRDAAALAGIEALPWDYWGPAQSFGPVDGVPERDLPAIDALGAALDPSPADRVESEAVLARFPWARPGPTVWTFSPARGALEETPIRPQPAA